VLIELLESLERPKAFAVRLLNPDVPDCTDVQNFFDTVVKPVVEDELGYRLVVIDGHHAYEHARIDQEIVAKLHRSSVVSADLTGARPNCFLELGYALGRGLPTMAPSIASVSSSAGMATISLDLSAALTWPSTNRWRANACLQHPSGWCAISFEHSDRTEVTVRSPAVAERRGVRCRNRITGRTVARDNGSRRCTPD
jgi:hypothetical protein